MSTASQQWLSCSTLSMGDIPPSVSLISMTTNNQTAHLTTSLTTKSCCYKLACRRANIFVSLFCRAATTHEPHILLFLWTFSWIRSEEINIIYLIDRIVVVCTCHENEFTITHLLIRLFRSIITLNRSSWFCCVWLLCVPAMVSVV